MLFKYRCWKALFRECNKHVCMYVCMYYCGIAWSNLQQDVDRLQRIQSRSARIITRCSSEASNVKQNFGKRTFVFTRSKHFWHSPFKHCQEWEHCYVLLPSKTFLFIITLLLYILLGFLNVAVHQIIEGIIFFRYRASMDTSLRTEWATL